MIGAAMSNEFERLEKQEKSMKKIPLAQRPVMAGKDTKRYLRGKLTIKDLASM